MRFQLGEGPSSGLPGNCKTLRNLRQPSLQALLSTLLLSLERLQDVTECQPVRDVQQDKGAGKQYSRHSVLKWKSFYHFFYLYI